VALRHPAAGRDAACRQLRHLIDMAGHPAVTLQILSPEAGAHSAMGGLFEISRFAGPALPDLAYIEQPASARDLTRAANLDRYR
jgi:hypothetical protein